VAVTVKWLRNFCLVVEVVSLSVVPVVMVVLVGGEDG